MTNLLQMSIASLLLPMEAADLVCIAQMGRQQTGKIRGMMILEEILEKRKVKLYKQNFKELQKKLETWKSNLESNLPLTKMELLCFSSFRIEMDN